MTYTLALGIGIVLGYAVRGFIGREAHKLGSWVMNEAWQGEKLALEIVDRFKKKL